MAGSLNQVNLIGRLTRDPETRHTQSGDPICHINLATNESWKDKNTGERKERAEFHRIVIFNSHLAKIAEDYLQKGSLAYFSGQLQTRKWADQQGVEKYTTEIVLGRYRGELTMLSEKGDGNAKTARPAKVDPNAPLDDFDDTIPF